MYQIKDKDFLGSQGKLIDILEYIFSKDESYIDLNEISNLFKLSKSGSYRILSVLIKKGFLEHKKGDSKFFLSNKTYNLSKKLIFKELIYLVAEKRILELNEKLKEDVYLFKLENKELKLIYTNSKKSEYSYFPVYATSFGKTILSYLNDRKRKDFLKNLNLEPFTKFTKINYSELLSELDMIRKNGYSISLEEFTYGFCDISAPIFVKKGKKVYSLGIIVSKTKLSESIINELIKALKNTKKKIEKDLSYLYKFQ